MNHPVSVKVNFRGNVKKFPVVDPDKAQWETVEAWVSTSLVINTTYTAHTSVISSLLSLYVGQTVVY